MTSAFMEYPIKIPLYQYPRTLSKDTIVINVLEHSIKIPLYRHPRTLNKDTIVPTP